MLYQQQSSLCMFSMLWVCEDCPALPGEDTTCKQQECGILFKQECSILRKKNGKYSDFSDLPTTWANISNVPLDLFDSNFDLKSFFFSIFD